MGTPPHGWLHITTRPTARFHPGVARFKLSCAGGLWIVTSSKQILFLILLSLRLRLVFFKHKSNNDCETQNLKYWAVLYIPSTIVCKNQGFHSSRTENLSHRYFTCLAPKKINQIHLCNFNIFTKKLLDKDQEVVQSPSSTNESCQRPWKDPF